MTAYNQLPYYVKLGIRVLIVLLIIVFIYIAQDVIVPLYFSLLLSVLLLPFTNFLERMKVPRIAANLIAIILALLFIAGLIYFLSTQISHFLSDVPTISKNLSEHFDKFQHWMYEKLHISFKQQSVLIQNAAAEVKSSGGEYIGQTFNSLTQMVFSIIIVTIYSFLILYYRHMLRSFLFQVFQKDHSERVEHVLMESKNVIKNYMTGLMIEMAIIAAANSLVLSIIGIKYAIFLGVFAAILNIIPYIGIFTGTLFTVLVAMTTSATMSDITWIIVSMAIIHMIDSNFLMPRIVGSKVKINALMTIIGVFIGGSLIGLAGIFLALPTIAILKIIFDRTEDLKPWGMLLGDEVTESKSNKLYKQIKKNIRRKPKVKPAAVPPVKPAPPKT